MKAFILILLISVALQVHAQDGGGGQERSEKFRLEKLEKAVSELGAERERARAAKQEAKTNTLIERNICDRTRLDLLESHRLEKLEKAVSELGAERQRARAAKQEANQEVKIQRY
jgi:coenzyme F420-reducing hydrogenase delta subunit